jgi:hypothetical protein
MIDDASHVLLNSLSLDDYGASPTGGNLFQYFILSVNALCACHENNDIVVESDIGS